MGSLCLGAPLGAPGSGPLACSVAGEKKKPVSRHGDVCRGEEGRHVKPQLLPDLTGLHTGTRRQLGQVAEAPRNQGEVVGEMSHRLEVPPWNKMRTGSQLLAGMECDKVVLQGWEENS